MGVVWCVPESPKMFVILWSSVSNPVVVPTPDPSNQACCFFFVSGWFLCNCVFFRQPHVFSTKPISHSSSTIPRVFSGFKPISCASWERLISPRCNLSRTSLFSGEFKTSYMASRVVFSINIVPPPVQTVLIECSLVSNVFCC